MLYKLGKTLQHKSIKRPEVFSEIRLNTDVSSNLWPGKPVKSLDVHAMTNISEACKPLEAINQRMYKHGLAQTTGSNQPMDVHASLTCPNTLMHLAFVARVALDGISF